MFLKPILFLFLTVAYGYNIDTTFPIVYLYSAKFSSTSYFGYTVCLYHESINNTSWLIVGAPRANYSSFVKQKFRQLIEPGVVYRCSLDSPFCQEMKQKEIRDEESYITQLEMNIVIKKQRGWFGSAMSIDKSNGVLTVCAPRTIVSIFNPYDNIHFDTMQGMCYSGKISSTVLSTEYEDLEYHNFRSNIWYNPMYGFSIHYASIKQNKTKEVKERRRITGKPMHETYGIVEIIQENKRLLAELPLNDELSQFGYSVESGYFFNKSQLLYVSGAPGWHYVGQVAIIDATTNVTSIVAKLQGTSTGEFFGASLAVGDIDNDGFDDLLVGAPYWEQDNGKVYGYFGTSKGHFEEVITLQGIVESSHFGYAIASGDLDADGFDDIIVGAPWEDSGVVYIYNGGTDLKHKNLRASERIEAIHFSLPDTYPKLERFGFSTSKPIDIDGNGYLDIPVGAYKSGYAVVLRSKPVVKTELLIRTVPSVLERDAKQFIVEICPRYDGYNIQNMESEIRVTVDEQHQRTKEKLFQMKSSTLTSTACFETRVNILRNIRDFIEPISILARHDFVNTNASSHFCKFCPVERRTNKLNVAQILLPFNIDCGTDKICNSNISATAKFYGVRDNDTWIVGSTEVNLEISLKNYGEPAYLTTLQFTFPKGVILRSILPFCQEDTSKDKLLVFCEAGNPLWKGEERNITLDLDMKDLIHDSLYNRELNFYIAIETRSTNQGTTSITRMLNLVNEVSLSLNGKANEEAYYLSTIKDAASNISFQHTYQVYKLGATPVEDAQLVIKVPVAINVSDPLIYIYKPQLYVSGELFECFSKDILLDTESIDVQREWPMHKFDMHVVTNKMQETVDLKHKRDVNETRFELYNVKNIAASQLANESFINDILYMNCSTSNVYCTTIVCNLSVLKTLQDIGKVLIKLVLNVERLKDILTSNKVVLKFDTEATVEILKPAVRLPVNETRSTIQLATMFYNSPKSEELQLWIIIASISVGLLLLIIFAMILSMLGFFKRKGKQNLSNDERLEETKELPRD
ncbi:PREDICTED: integrin alpha-PS3-like [Dufourea novaeangliae]|uniref:integrin alpha-PS3-like n=1 Tax=Dufourea novaeangliae TaxID=178035 RepID=UPI000767C2E8|nr:PREDICTED: integrin alpha-PS3-like [Dufourea novaeangliae]